MSNYYDCRNYRSVKGHMEGHDFGQKLKKMILEWCDRESAQTIRRAVESVDEDALLRRVARAVTKDKTYD